MAIMASSPRIDGAGIEAAWSISCGVASSLAASALLPRVDALVRGANTSGGMPVPTRSRARPVTAPTTEATRRK